MSQAITIDHLNVFEWYDGCVAGIAECDGAPLVVCMVSFDADHTAKRFAYLPVSGQEVRHLQELYEKDGLGPSFNHFWLSALTSKDIGFLAKHEPKMGAHVTLTVLNEAQFQRLKHYSLPCIDEAVSDEANLFWA